MKIIEACRQGAISYVQLKQCKVIVTIQKEGDIVAITSSGRGNVRFAKSQAKMIHNFLNGE